MLARIRRFLAPPTEQRASYGTVGWGPNVAATRINAAIAENLSTVTACVNAISGGLATLPAYVYRHGTAGRVEAPDHPVARLLRQPNSRQTWADWLEMTLGQVLLHGNAISIIETDATGQPVALIPVPWPSVQVTLLPSGRLAFDVVATMAGGQTRRLLEADVWHLKDRSDDGYLGRSRISRAPDVLAAAVGLQTYSSAIWDNAATPSGMLELPPNISVSGKAQLDAHFAENYAGAANGKKVLYVDRDTKWTSLSATPEDAEVLASRQFSVIELCRLFNVPPPIIQAYENNTFTNAAQASTWFATNTLAPWARKIEAEFKRQLFGPDSPCSLELDMSGLMRGDYQTRWAANVAAVVAGILTADEVRAQEGWNPLPAGAAPAAAALESDASRPPI